VAVDPLPVRAAPGCSGRGHESPSRSFALATPTLPTMIVNAGLNMWMDWTGTDRRRFAGGISLHLIFSACSLGLWIGCSTTGREGQVAAVSNGV